MSEDKQPGPVKSTHSVRRAILYTALPIVAFLRGFVPMWLRSRGYSSRLAEAERQLDLARMKNSLASAAIGARRGEYETARQDASDFFTALRAETDRGADSALSQAQIDSAQRLFVQRDQIITLLARGDGAAADLLSDLYVSYRKLEEPWGSV